MSTVAVPAPHVTSWPKPERRRLSVTRTQAKAIAVAIAIIAALEFRMTALSSYGFSEDEIHKVQAIDQYRAGHFSANAEHPMLMKLAMWGSLELRDTWNLFAPPGGAVALETALRLPNALAGTLTTIALFGVADVLFGTSVAAVASMLWALDVNAIAIGRIGKEDSFLLLFFLTGIWYYERAKRQGVTDPVGAQGWYTKSGVSFGLMLASKYFPHYFGIYSLFNVVTDRHPGANRPDKRRFYGAMALGFFAANFAILLPDTWRYCASYLQGGTLTHHGYLYAGQLYVTNIPLSPLGLPVTYYLRFIATKVPLSILVMTAVGLFEVARHRDQRGFVLLRVFFVFLLVPYSLMAAKFLRYTLPMLVVIDLTAAVGLVALLRGLERTRRLAAVESRPMTMALLILALGTVATATATTAPFYSLYQNAIGARLAAPGTTFSEETYDFGVREAVTAIASVAGPFAVIVSDAPEVVGQYVKSSGRVDLRVRPLSGQGPPYGSSEAWIIVQDEHITFENQAVVEQMRHRLEPWREFRAGDVVAAQVFRIEGS